MKPGILRQNIMAKLVSNKNTLDTIWTHDSHLLDVSTRLTVTVSQIGSFFNFLWKGRISLRVNTKKGGIL